MNSKIIPMALGLALVAGCAVNAPNAANPLDFSSIGQSLSLSSADRTLAAQYVQDLSSQMQIENDQTTSELTAAQQQPIAGYSVTSLAGLQARLQQAKDRMQSRLALQQSECTIKKTGPVDVAGGLQEYTVTMDRTTANLTIHRTVVRDLKGGNLVHLGALYHAEHKDGMIFDSTRVKDLNADGSYLVTFDSKLTRKDGKVKTVHWVRNGSADGVETSSEGTITRFDGSTVTVTVTKTADGTTVSKIVTPKVGVTASQPDASSSVDVTITDPASGKSESQTIKPDSDGEAVEPSAG